MFSNNLRWRDSMAVDFAGSRVTLPRLFPGKPKLDAAVFRGMKKSVIHVQQLARKNATNQGVFKSASGRLAGSIAREVKVEGNNIVGRIGSALVYAGIQEGLDKTNRPKTHTIIKAKNKKLAIPIGEARTKAGRARFTSPRQVPNLRAIPRRGKATLLARVVARNKIIPMFVLKDSVKIKARPYMRPALKTGFFRATEIIMNEVIKVVDAS